jgi:hypothetical protein
MSLKDSFMAAIMRTNGHVEGNSKCKEGRNGYREHSMDIAYQEEQDYNTHDMCLGLDL